VSASFAGGLVEEGLDAGDVVLGGFEVATEAEGGAGGGAHVADGRELAIDFAVDIEGLLEVVEGCAEIFECGREKLHEMLRRRFRDLKAVNRTRSFKVWIN
jgi:hypothetical protein